MTGLANKHRCNLLLAIVVLPRSSARCPTLLPLLTAAAGVRRTRIKVALNVGANDLLMVLTSDAELPWLESAINRAALVPVGVTE